MTKFDKALNKAMKVAFETNHCIGCVLNALAFEIAALIAHNPDDEDGRKMLGEIMQNLPRMVDAVRFEHEEPAELPEAAMH
jgi:hypothetical protein